MTKPNHTPFRFLALALLLAGFLVAGGHPATADDDGHGHHPTAGGAEGTPPALPVWVPPNEPARIAALDAEFTDQSGRSGVLADLVDRPVLLTFFYTRCQNSKKCPLTVSRLAGLQRRLQKAGLADRVRLLVVTYEPQFDTPARLERYVVNRGLELGPEARAIRLDPDRQQEVVDSLRVPVNYNTGWVNGHGVELNLLEAGGRLIKKYHAVFWDNPQVVEDLRALLAAESPGQP